MATSGLQCLLTAKNIRGIVTVKNIHDIIHPAEEFSSIMPPYLFMKWSMDIMRPMLIAPGGLRFLLILTDSFSKWVEAGAFIPVKYIDVETIIRQKIISRHGKPPEIVAKNGAQLISKKFRQFCFNNNVKLRMSTPRYPRGNGHAETTDKTIVNSIKNKLTVKKGTVG